MPGKNPAAVRCSIGAQAPNAGKPSLRALPGLQSTLFWVLLLVLAGCTRPAPEQALRNTIASMQAAAQSNQTDALFEPIAQDFSGSEGMDRKQFRRYVTFAGLRNQKVGVQLGPMEIKLFPDRASASFTLALTGGATWLPDRAQVYDVDTGWRLDGGEWKLISAKWKPRL